MKNAEKVIDAINSYVRDNGTGKIVSREEFYEIVKKLNEEGVTIIMVSHDMKSVEYATHVLHMDRMDSFFGTKGQYLHSEKGKQFQMLGGHKMNTCTICRFTQKNEKNTFYQDK